MNDDLIEEATEAVLDALSEQCAPRRMTHEEYREVLDRLIDDLNDRLRIANEEAESIDRT